MSGATCGLCDRLITRCDCDAEAIAEERDRYRAALAWIELESNKTLNLIPTPENQAAAIRRVQDLGAIAYSVLHGTPKFASEHLSTQDPA